MKSWRKLRIGDVLVRVKDDVQVDDFVTYSRITIRMAGKGVALRDRVIGSEIGTKRQFIARAGQFVLSKIDARNGAFGVLPEECDNAIVTGNFWVFDVDHTRLDSRFFNYLSKSPEFVAACVAASDGTTNRRYLQEDAFLHMEVPVPDLPEQQAIVARLDALAEKTRQVEAHLDAVERDAEHLLALRFRDVIADAPLRPMAEVAPLVRRDVVIDPERSYTELGVRSFYKGAFHRRTVPGSDFSWQDLYRVQAGDLIFSNIMAWEQAIAIAQPEDDGCVGNHRMLTCEANVDIAVPGFLWYYFTTEEGFAKIYAASPGTAARNRTMTAPALMAIEVPMPSLAVQHTFDRLQAEIAALKAKHTAIRQANAALIPSTLERVFGVEATGARQ
ncbi:restriction endonuclease subunit S [Laribacter hongkongensis]|uniref:restriction endonuclease subunit S n=1 Tax=Laribacter hongkongensis TaxID=168471 RepID=UPI001EFC5844|nr:restriction endonuclease subunit S [Laribacter hongkongensis]MCG9075551.1 restriction endonuclease subunit S [Laribacter hongkongensis]